MTVKSIINKIESLISEVSLIHQQLNTPLSRGKRQEYRVRLISKQGALKAYHSQLNDMFKGNQVYVKFSVPKPGQVILEVYEITFSNLSKDDVVQLLQYKFGPKVNILEIKDTPTLLKKVGLS